MHRRISFARTWPVRNTLFAILLSSVILGTGCTSMFYSPTSGGQLQGSKVPTLTVTSSATISTYGTPVAFMATVSNDVNGSVTFYDAGTAIGTRVLQNNTATLTTSSLGAGSHSITATWPGNANIGPITSQAIIHTVNQAVPTIAWPEPEPISYGTALTANQLDASSNGIAGTFTYTPDIGTVLAVGAQTLSATFTATDTVDYATATKTVQLTVNRATPSILWLEPEAIDFGIPLSEVQLDASSPAAGSFAYSPAAGTILDPGQHTLTATFTPTDSADYNDAIVTVTQTVMQPSIIVTAPVSSLLPRSSEVLTVTVTGAVNQSVEWEVNGIPGGDTQVGTITPGGLYTAPDSSNATVTIAALLQADPTFNGSTQVQIVGPKSSPGTIGFAYMLPDASATSAGVYDSSGTLVRTLWSNERKSAGVHTAMWDGNDDSGTPAPPGSYQIRVLYNNVTYTWGLIGDTSTSWTATNSWDMQDLLPDDIAVLGTKAYTANGYAELRPNASSFDLSDPQQAQALFDAGYCNQIEFVATDGKLVYFANVGNGWTSSAAYVFAYNPATQSYYDFAAGTLPYSCSSNAPKAVIDYVPNLNNPGSQRTNVPTALAVQSNGNLLAVSHGADVSMHDATNAPGEDQIKLFDKTSGTLVGEVPIQDPQGIAFAPDNSLWAISGSSVVHITSVGDHNIVTATLRGLSKPLALAVDSTTGDVLVADGGMAQQVKRFSPKGKLLSVFGDLGGYTDCDPTVSKTRLFLDTAAGPDYSGYSVRTFVVALPDGSFWVGDPGNARVLHISSSGKYIEQIAFLRFLYHVAADHGNPTRVFADTLEFSVDYSKLLVPGDPDMDLGGNSSWSLVKNWSACLPSNYLPMFTQVQTFGNGRTYALVPNLNIKSPWSGELENELVELPASGPLRSSGTMLIAPPGFPEFFNHRGDLAYWIYKWSGSSSTQIAYRETLTGYNSEGWPVWDTPSQLGSVPIVSSTDPWGFGGWGMYFWPEETSGGVLVTYMTAPATPGQDHHLGGVPVGGTNWSWKASPGAVISTPDGKGTFPDVQSFGGHNGIAALVEGSNIFEGYDGQYGTFSSQWMQWSQDGLLIGQFGHPAYGLEPDLTLFPGAAGNIWSMTTVSAGDDIYLYNSDEGYHPGIHRWKVSGLDTIHEVAGSASLGGTVILQ